MRASTVLFDDDSQNSDHHNTPDMRHLTQEQIETKKSKIKENEFFEDFLHVSKKAKNVKQ